MSHVKLASGLLMALSCCFAPLTAWAQAQPTPAPQETTPSSGSDWALIPREWEFPHSHNGGKPTMRPFVGAAWGGVLAERSPYPDNISAQGGFAIRTLRTSTDLGMEITQFWGKGQTPQVGVFMRTWLFKGSYPNTPFFLSGGFAGENSWLKRWNKARNEGRSEADKGRKGWFGIGFGRTLMFEMQGREGDDRPVEWFPRLQLVSYL